jgi:tetratricopeptide (TPR) repeat protein
MSDAKIPEQGTRIVCPKCKTSFFVQKDAVQPTEGTSEKEALEYYQAGIAFLKNKQVDAAIEQLRVAITMKPDYVEAYRYLGLACMVRKVPGKRPVRCLKKLSNLSLMIYFH